MVDFSCAARLQEKDAWWIKGLGKEYHPLMSTVKAAGCKAAYIANSATVKISFME